MCWYDAHVYLETCLCRENGTNSNLLVGDESPFGNWSSIINYNSSFDSRTEFEDRISPDNALWINECQQSIFQCDVCNYCAPIRYSSLKQKKFIFSI